MIYRGLYLRFWGLLPPQTSNFRQMVEFYDVQKITSYGRFHAAIYIPYITTYVLMEKFLHLLI